MVVGISALATCTPPAPDGPADPGSPPGPALPPLLREPPVYQPRPDVTLQRLTSLSDVMFNVLDATPAFPDLDLEGVGVVGGLQGTGDLGPAHEVAAAEARRRFPDATADMLVPGALALVRVRAREQSLRPGRRRFDVTIAALGTAESLVGGYLTATTLYADSLAGLTPWAQAQGDVLTERLGDGGRTALLVDGGELVTESSLAAARMNVARARLRVPHVELAAAVLGALNARFPGSAKIAADGHLLAALPAEFAGQREAFVRELEMTRFTLDRPRQGLVLVDAARGALRLVGRDTTLRPGAVAGALVAEANRPLLWKLLVLRPEEEAPPRAAGAAPIVEVQFRRARSDAGSAAGDDRYEALRRFRMAGELGALIETMDALGLDRAGVVDLLRRLVAAEALRAAVIID